MIMKQRALLALLAGMGASVASAAPSFDGQSWWATVRVLADDRYEGRDTGSTGEQQAQAYVVGQLQRLKVSPAGSAGYYQPVALHTRSIVEADSSLVLVRGTEEQALTLGEDAFFNTRYALAPSVAADLVFVGYGLAIPERNYSDYAGLDLKGKVAVFITGSPADIPSALSAHAQSLPERWKQLRGEGAIGLITIPNPASMDMPWSRYALNRRLPSMYLDGAEFDDTAGSQIAVTFNPAHAELLFAGTGHSFAELAALAKERKPLPRFALNARLRARARTESAAVESRNVVARIAGSDPALRRTYVVLSAHIDHLGIGEPINGDRIYNGAMDNGSGSALLLDLARDLRAKHAKPPRSILLVWVTGEEKGLLGSRYFATRPTVPKRSMIADVNIDMFLPIFPAKILTAYGLDESDLGDRLKHVAAGLGLSVQGDPQPLRNVFIRSDQYNFVRQGIPSLMVDIGAAPGSAEEELRRQWLATRYHAPSDDAQQPVNLAAAATFEDVIERLVLSVADDPKAPRWNADSFFRRYAVAGAQ